jgi:hypothetical protein
MIFGINRWGVCQTITVFLWSFTLLLVIQHLCKLCVLSKIFAGEQVLLNDCFLLCANSEHGNSVQAELDLTYDNITPTIAKMCS